MEEDEEEEEIVEPIPVQVPKREEKMENSEAEISPDDHHLIDWARSLYNQIKFEVSLE